MSLRESTEALQGDIAPKGSQLDGFPSRVVNYMNNNDKSQLQELAEEVWRVRMGGISTKKQMDGDYEEAMRLAKIYVYINKTTPNSTY